MSNVPPRIVILNLVAEAAASTTEEEILQRNVRQHDNNIMKSEQEIVRFDI
jgi:hypothetical protein